MSQRNQAQTREIVLDKERNSRDVIEFNAFWAATPERVRLVYEEEWQNGLWQLVLYDMKRPGKSWRLGAYLDAYESRRTLYDMPLVFHYGRYIDDRPDMQRYDITNSVIKDLGGEFVIDLPDQWRPDIVIRIPAICGAGYPLAEPVLLGTLDNRYFALDCASGLYEFETLDELTEWVREQECPEGHEYPVIHWWEWHIVKNGEVVYSNYTQPSPQEVIDALRRHIRPT
jgi:hypothetical protein